MAHHFVRFVARLALAAGIVFTCAALSGCVLMPGGGWYGGGDDHHDYVRHDD